MLEGFIYGLALFAIGSWVAYRQNKRKEQASSSSPAVAPVVSDGKSTTGATGLQSQQRRDLIISLAILIALFGAIGGLWLYAAYSSTYLEKAIQYEKDGSYEKALEYYKKAALKGDAAAQCRLGKCYLYGQIVRRSPERAVPWFLRAADQDFAEAQSFLGLCYEEGTGVRKNAEQSVAWYRKAAQQGEPLAQKRLQERGIIIPSYNGAAATINVKNAAAEQQGKRKHGIVSDGILLVIMFFVLGGVFYLNYRLQRQPHDTEPATPKPAAPQPVQKAEAPAKANVPPPVKSASPPADETDPLNMLKKCNKNKKWDMS